MEGINYGGYGGDPSGTPPDPPERLGALARLAIFVAVGLLIAGLIGWLR